MTERPSQRTPNRQLAALIAEAGFSNAGLARRVDQLGLEHGLDLRYDKTSVTRWLRGQQPRGTTPALIAEVFTRRLGRRLAAQDLGLDACAPVYAGLEFAATPEEAVDIVGGLWRKDSGSHAELRKIAFTPAGLVVPSRDWLIGRADERVGRDAARWAAARVPHQGGAGCPGSAAPPTAGRGSGSPAGTSRRCGRSGELFRTLDHAYGGGHARQALVRYLEHEAEPMLRGAYGENTGRRLFAAVADLTRLAGWTSYDIAAHGLAQRYFVQALRLAQAAGDRAYGSYVLVTMSRQAVYLGHGREAVQLTRVAQQGVGAAAPPVVQALLHSVEARGHGVLGEVRACAAALVRAERALETARPGDEAPHWARFFDEAQLADDFGALPPGSPAVPVGGAARGALAAAAFPGLCAQPAVLPGGAGLLPARRWASWTRRARWGRRRRFRRRRCGRRGPWSTCGSSSAAWSRTGTRRRCGRTGTGYRRWADPRGDRRRGGLPGPVVRVCPQSPDGLILPGPRRRGPVLRRGRAVRAWAHRCGSALDRQPGPSAPGLPWRRVCPPSPDGLSLPGARRRRGGRSGPVGEGGAGPSSCLRPPSGPPAARPRARRGPSGLRPRPGGPSRGRPGPCSCRGGRRTRTGPTAAAPAGARRAAAASPGPPPGRGGPRAVPSRTSAPRTAARDVPAPPGRDTRGGAPSTVEEISTRPRGARDGSTSLITAVWETGPSRSASSTSAAPVGGACGALWCSTVTGWNGGTRSPGSSSAACRAPVASTRARQVSSPYSSVLTRLMDASLTRTPVSTVPVGSVAASRAGRLAAPPSGTHIRPRAKPRRARSAHRLDVVRAGSQSSAESSGRRKPSTVREGSPRAASESAVVRSGRAVRRSAEVAASRARDALSRASSSGRGALARARATVSAPRRALPGSRVRRTVSPVRWSRPPLCTSTPGANGRRTMFPSPVVRCSSGYEVLSNWPMRSSRKPSICWVAIRPPT